mmetsp:Transcript_6489/g.16111  ORF Transcript_6489/g.16111 Transcript_6489/m.16111 type:complete len:100 (+) Transcript_6489:3808-4107(+)
MQLHSRNKWGEDIHERKRGRPHQKLEKYEGWLNGGRGLEEHFYPIFSFTTCSDITHSFLAISMSMPGCEHAEIWQSARYCPPTVSKIGEVAANTEVAAP